MTTTTALLALLLAGAPGPGSAPECTIGGTSEAADEDRSLARAACERARQRFEELFGGPVPEVRVILREKPGYRVGTQEEAAAIVWPTSRAMADQAGDGARAEAYVAAQWREVLPHEIAHALMTARFYPDHTGSPGRYGTPLPDWLDEAVAIWAEPEASRAIRLDEARALPAERRDLETILRSPHPAVANPAALAMRDGAPPPDDAALRAFYPQSIAVLGFVHATGGEAAVRELVARLVARPDAPAELAGLPGMPADADGVEAAWEAWMDRGAYGVGE